MPATAAKLVPEQLIRYLKDDLQASGDIDNDSPLFSSGELDSMAMVQLIGFIEDRGGLQVNAEDVTLEHFDTVASIIKYVEARA
jgi:acyl carrier protein